jgi:taurine dioxygenase
MTQFEIRNLSPTVGAEIIGFDPQAEIDQDMWNRLSRTFDERVMLVFRDIDLSVPRQHEIVEILQAGGDMSAPQGIDADRFSYVSNKEENGGAPYGRLMYHSDMMWSDIANQTPSLYAVEAQQPSTPTTFTNIIHAWKALPEDLKERLKGLSARHESGQQGRGNTAYEDQLIQPQWSKLRETVKPIAMPHPRTGEIMLYVCEQQTREIVGLPKKESDALLDQLFEHMYRPEWVISHQWRTGDLVIWDNMAAQHGRPYVEGGGPARTLRKIHAPNKVLDAYLKSMADIPSYEKAM